ncbi:MAG: EamA family transporter [Candidatus Kerfeldbacteria bacterium]|nr:EamA family transporter [Candidatus Kerfeldbacteria bacterium]
MGIGIFGENYWLFICLMAPMFWAMVNIIDVYFVDGIYKDEWDGVIIFGLFQIIPSILLLFFIKSDFLIKLVDFQSGNFFLCNSLLLAILGGFFFSFAFFFYYKALFNQNDVALLQILWNFSVLVVPIIAFLFLGERLPLYKYIGMVITLFGATLILFDKKLKMKFSSKYALIMLGVVILFSVGMVIGEKVYSNLNSITYGNQGFLIGFLFFSIGSFLGGVFFMFYGKRNPINLIKRYYKIFFISEGLTFLGTLASQRAIDISPSVSYVATVETFTPVFILIFSFLILLLLKFTKNKQEIVKKIYNKQLDGILIKIFAVGIMAIGIFIIS